MHRWGGSPQFPRRPRGDETYVHVSPGACRARCDHGGHLFKVAPTLAMVEYLARYLNVFIEGQRERQAREFAQTMSDGAIYPC